MHKELKELIHYKIIAQDEEIGKVTDFYFDEQLWTVRYIVVNTGGWLMKNLVLLSPVFVDEIDEEKRELKVSLTRDQVEDSPDIDAAKPISRQKEIELATYYSSGYYWSGYNVWGMAPVPISLRNIRAEIPRQESGDEETHLRSLDEVLGYHIKTNTDELGHVEDMIINRFNWSIDFFVLNTRNLLPGGKRVEISIRWIQDISWETRKVYIKLSKELLEAAAQ